MTTEFTQHRNATKQKKIFSLRSKDMSTDKAHLARVDLAQHQPFIEGKDDIFDVLTRHKSSTHHSLDTDDNAASLRKTLTKAEQTIAACEQRIKMLEHIKTIDELTGLQNIRGFENAFKRELARTKRDRRHAGILILIDLESYDSTKNTYGPLAANALVKLVSKILSEEIRDMDIAARLSKNEFVLLFSNTAAEKVVSRVQKLALRINNLSLIWKKEEINVNASLALRGYGPTDSFEVLLKSNLEQASAE